MDGFKLPSIPSHTLQPEVKREELKPEEIVHSWLARLAGVVADGSYGDLADLFVQDCWWRDIVALNWDFSSKQGRDNVGRYLAGSSSRLGDIRPIHDGGLKSVLVDIAGMIWIQGGFTFTNGHGSGRGLVKLINVDKTEWKAWIVFTQLERLDFQDELEAQRRQNPAAAAAALKVEESPGEEQKDPQVLIVGAGQAGLSLGARLSSMGIRTLLVDRNARLGDSWRARYKTVTLNTPTYTDHPPFLKIPDTWPRWLPRDRVADFLEHYGQIMGLDCLLSAEVTAIQHDEPARRYRVHLRRGEWSTVLSPRHVVLATGVFGDQPVIPRFPGQEAFTGQMYHSSQHVSAAEVPALEQKRVVVIGPGTSGQDIAQDFVNNGASEVSIVQRNPIFYLSAESSEAIQLALWNMPGITTDEADLLGNATPLAIIRTMSIGMSHAMTELDKVKIESLKKAGLALRTGHDGYGLADYQLIKGGQYYLDQGAGQMIVDGKIKIHGCEGGVGSFQADGLMLANGKKLRADIVVLATGYHSNKQTVERLMGPDVASKLSPHFGVLDEENERAGWWRPTGQPGFWYMTGSFMWCRQFSLPLALQIAAVEKGLNAAHYEDSSPQTLA